MFLTQRTCFNAKKTKLLNGVKYTFMEINGLIIKQQEAEFRQPVVLRNPALWGWYGLTGVDSCDAYLL